jgi:hypothetical protein
MNEQELRTLDELRAEVLRVAEAQEAQPVRPRPVLSDGRRLMLAGLVGLIVLSGAAYALPVTRGAIEDLAGVGGENDEPGRALRPGDDAPAWVRDSGGRVIAETDGFELYAARTQPENLGSQLALSLDGQVTISDTVEGWREQFEDKAVIVLGPGFAGPGKPLDDRGRFPLFGVTAGSIRRVELLYTDGPPLVSRVDGGFVLMADASRTLDSIVALDSAGREVERADISHIDVG